jgi:hypothetical protein
MTSDPTPVEHRVAHVERHEATVAVVCSCDWTSPSYSNLEFAHQAWERHSRRPDPTNERRTQ